MTSDMITNLKGHGATASINLALDAIANPDALLADMTTIIDPGTPAIPGMSAADVEYSYHGDEGNDGETAG